jgi:hypothetical protein
MTFQVRKRRKPFGSPWTVPTTKSTWQRRTRLDCARPWARSSPTVGESAAPPRAGAPEPCPQAGKRLRRSVSGPWPTGTAPIPADASARASKKHTSTPTKQTARPAMVNSQSTQLPSDAPVRIIHLYRALSRPEFTGDCRLSEIWGTVVDTCDLQRRGDHVGA